MTRLKKTLSKGYHIGNDHAVDIYENVMRKIPLIKNEFFAPIENLWRDWSKLQGVEWADTSVPDNLTAFEAWIQEELS